MSTAFYTHASCIRHEMGSWHPESPARLQAIDEHLTASGLAANLEARTAPPATLEQIRRIHSAGAVSLVRENIPLSGYYPLGADTSLNEHSWEAAVHAAGAAVAATDAVMRGEVDNAFCSVRPPGHHAMPAQPMGFCMFNNVAIAARHALDVHGLERVAVIDFDVHHGNGTEAAFLDDARVLMVSFFQHPFYPYSGAGGDSQNRAHMRNAPLPAYTAGDTVRALVNEHWLPALHAHRPQMLFISAGFDAHRDDDMGQMGLVEEDFAWITEQMVEVARAHAGGRIVSCLEGGYNLAALGRSVAAHLRVLAGLPQEA